MDSMPLFEEPAATPLDFERRARRRGRQVIAGIDEAGRGPLAGPVVAAAVVLPEQFDLPGLTDSKQLSPLQRQRLYPLIRQQACGIGVGVASAAEIDHLNILQATLLAMRRALGRLSPVPDHLLIDGITRLPLAVSQETLKQGDSRSLSIAAASVVAKVIRDRIMLSFDRCWPEYGFLRHKGYGTREHRQALDRFGPSQQHRRSFAGVTSGKPA